MPDLRTNVHELEAGAASSLGAADASIGCVKTTLPSEMARTLALTASLIDSVLASVSSSDTVGRESAAAICTTSSVSRRRTPRRS